MVEEYQKARLWYHVRYGMPLPKGTTPEHVSMIKSDWLEYWLGRIQDGLICSSNEPWVRQCYESIRVEE